MTDISKAIQSLNKKGNVNHQFVCKSEPTNETEYNSNIDYISGADANGNAIFSNTKPYTWSEVNAEKTLLQIEYDAKEYQRKRQAEYPPMADYLDAIVKGDDTQKQKYIDDCKAVKEKYPK